MSRALAICTVLFALLSGCAQQPAPRPDTRAADEQAIRSTDIDWSNAAATKNPDRAASYYADDAVMLPPNIPKASGKQAIQEVWKQFMAMPGFAISWQPDSVQASRGGDLGYTTGTYQLTINGPKGQPINDRGKYVAVFKKQADGSWKAVADIFNSDLPAAGGQ